MFCWLMLITLADNPGELAAATAPAAVVQNVSNLDRFVAELTPQLQTGTLFFSQGKSVVVRLVGRSRFTHVAAVVVRPEGVCVYDAMRTVGVRRLSLRDHLAVQAGDAFEICQPTATLSPEQALALQCSLERRVGTEYAYSQYLTGCRSTGVHCSEYITDGLIEADVLSAERPPRVTPASLRQAVLSYELYASQAAFRLLQPPVADAPQKSCLSGLWGKTCWANAPALP